MTTFENRSGEERADFPPYRLVACELGCTRGDRRVFAGLSFSLGAGEMLTLGGPNGSGKSSLLRQIAGLLDVPGGTLALEGATEGARPWDVALYAGHLDAVKGPLTVAENLRFWADFHGVDRAGVGPALEGLGLGSLALLPAGILSAGQKKRLGLARLLLIERPLWLLDEPTVSLDAVTVAVLTRLMETHLARGGLIVAASHVALGIDGGSRLDLGTISSADRALTTEGAL